MKIFTVCKLRCLTQPLVLQCWMNGRRVWLWCHFKLVSDCLETAFWTCFSTLGIFLSHILKLIICRFQVIYALSNAYCTYFINKLLSKFNASCVNAVLVELFAWGKGPTCAWGKPPRGMWRVLGLCPPASFHPCVLPGFFPPGTFPLGLFTPGSSPPPLGLFTPGSFPS